ncbi:prosaposin-like isoform X1 [Zingiber officinale]|uniref:prosaposin-like isoform X1 n=2 Tax=Zingiber officinale TaxID=94328 RepID=UPI001C4C1156|nr:prosaposin-like isoform X1 [Zingiber officinale]
MKSNSRLHYSHKIPDQDILAYQQMPFRLLVRNHLAEGPRPSPLLLGSSTLLVKNANRGGDLRLKLDASKKCNFDQVTRMIIYLQGSMGSRGWFFLVLILVIGWANADARSLAELDVLVTEVDFELIENPIRTFKGVKRNEQLCTLCENFASQAAQYLSKNKTQTEIIETLHQACSEMKPFEEQCLLLIDYYSALFFAEISKIHPEEFCTKFNLCEAMASISLLKTENSCTICHDVIAKVLVKLKDSDAQFEVIKMLLKECNEVEQYVQQCKKLVLHYGPLILVNGEKFLEDTDICTAIHACKTEKAELINDAVSEEPPVVASM